MRFLVRNMSLCCIGLIIISLSCNRGVNHVSNRSSGTNKTSDVSIDTTNEISAFQRHNDILLFEARLEDAIERKQSVDKRQVFVDGSKIHMFNSTIDSLETQIEKISVKIEGIKDASNESWSESKKDIENSLNELNLDIEQAEESY